MSCPTNQVSAVAGSASCADPPIEPLIDVAVLSLGLPDGVYYAGRQLTEWMTAEEHREHRTLWFDRDRLSVEQRLRLHALRARRIGQSLVIRWEIVDGQPGSQTILDGGWTQGLDDETGAAFAWDTGMIFDCGLAHEILTDLLRRGDYRSESSNRYLDVAEPPLTGLGPTWMLPQRAIAAVVAKKDLLDAAAQARAVGLDPAAVLSEAP